MNKRISKTEKRTETKKPAVTPSGRHVSGSEAPAAKVAPKRPATRDAHQTARHGKGAMTKDDRRKYRDLLFSMREKLVRQISFLSADSLNKERYDIPPDNGTDDFDRDFGLSLLSSEQDALFEVDEALRRLDEGTYGACEQCGDAIASSRLEALPFAKMCIKCQSTAEKDRPRFRPFGSTLVPVEEKVSQGDTAAGSDQ